MPETRLTCPSCKAVLKTMSVLPAGKSIKCPKCQGAIRVPGGEVQPAAAPTKPPAARPKPAPPPKKADPDEDEERDQAEEEEEAPRARPKAAPGKSVPRKADDDDEDDDRDEAEEEEETPRARPKAAPVKSVPRKADPDEDEERDASEEEEEETPRARSKSAPAKSPPRKTDPDEDEDEEREPVDEEAEDEDEKPRKKKKKKKDRAKKSSGDNKKMWLWLGIGGGAVAAVVVVLIIVLGGNKEDGTGGKKGGGGEGGGGETGPAEITLDRTIKTQVRNEKGLLFGASSDSGVIALGKMFEDTIRVVDGKTGDAISQFIAAGTDNDPIVAADGKTATSDGVGRTSIGIWEVKSGKRLQQIELGFKDSESLGKLSNLALSPRGDTVYMAISQQGIHGWNTATRQVVYTEKEKEASFAKKIFSHAVGNTLFVIDRPFEKPEAIRIYDTSKQGATKVIPTGHKWINYIAGSTDGKYFAVHGQQDEKKHECDVWSFETGQKLFTVSDIQPDGRKGISFQPNGRLLVSGTNELASFDPVTGTKKGYWKHDRKLNGKTITHVFLCPNGEIALVLDGDTVSIRFVRLKE